MSVQSRTTMTWATLAVGLLAVAGLPWVSAQPESAESLLPVLAEPQTAEDRLPAEFSSDESEMTEVDPIPESTRLVLEDEIGRAWMAVNGKEEICLLLEPTGTNVLGAACSPPAEVAGVGLNVGTGNSRTDITWAYVLPSKVTAAAAAASLENRWPGSEGWVVSGDSPVVMLLDHETRELGGGRLSFILAPGEIFTFPL